MYYYSYGTHHSVESTSAQTDQRSDNSMSSTTVGDLIEVLQTLDPKSTVYHRGYDPGGHLTSVSDLEVHVSERSKWVYLDRPEHAPHVTTTTRVYPAPKRRFTVERSNIESGYVVIDHAQDVRHGRRVVVRVYGLTAEARAQAIAEFLENLAMTEDEA